MNRECNDLSGAPGKDPRRIEDIRAEALAILEQAGRENGLPPEQADALGVRVTREMRREMRAYLEAEESNARAKA